MRMLALLLMVLQLQDVEVPTSAMREYGDARPPRGAVEFCARVPVECAAYLIPNKLVPRDAESMHWLDTINRMVNAEIAPATDMEQYGVAEYWAIPTTKGDCEDYALLKRKMLIALGLPPSALLVTAVLMDDREWTAHAVLTVRTDGGDYVLDNRTDVIFRWWRTGYRFVTRQSSVDPEQWVALTPNYVRVRETTGDRP